MGWSWQGARGRQPLHRRAQHCAWKFNTMTTVEAAAWHLLAAHCAWGMAALGCEEPGEKDSGWLSAGRPVCLSVRGSSNRADPKGLWPRMRRMQKHAPVWTCVCVCVCVCVCACVRACPLPAPAAALTCCPRRLAALPACAPCSCWTTCPMR